MTREPEELPETVVLVNPEDEVTPEKFLAWLDRVLAEPPLNLGGVRAADTLAELRADGELWPDS